MHTKFIRSPPNAPNRLAAFGPNVRIRKIAESDKRLWSMDAQIDISEYKNTEKGYNAYDTVIISENHTVCSNKRNTECYIYKNFKDINKKMM